MIGFTFNETQTMELESFCRDFVTFPFDEHNNTIVLDMMRSMSFLPRVQANDSMTLESSQLRLIMTLFFTLISFPKSLITNTWCFTQ